MVPRWHAGAHQLRDRLVAALQSETCFGNPSSLTTVLTPHCLCCGKGLSDPVSMSRMIGPECFGSQSQVLPFTFKLDIQATKVAIGDWVKTLPFEAEWGRS
jgi:hypothetical protein